MLLAAPALADEAAENDDNDRPPPHEEVSKERLMETLAALPTARSPIADQAHIDGLKETESLLKRKLEDLGHEVHEQVIEWAPPVRRRQNDENTEPPRWRNLWVDFPGETRPEEVLVIGAHFDAVPNSPGADDNGTGTAALVELARVLRDRPTERTIRLIFFNLEEVGLIGSARYVSQIAIPAQRDGKEKYVGMVSLEMLGYFSDEPGSQKTPMPRIEGVFEPSDVGDFIAIATVSRFQQFSGRFAEEMEAAEPRMEVFRFDFLPVPLPDILRSDHAPFMAAGIPAFMLTDTANFRNPHYHQPTDTIDTIDAERFTQVVRGVAAATHALARPIENGESVETE